MHDDARRREAELADDHECAAWRVPRRRAHARRVPAPRAQRRRAPLSDAHRVVPAHAGIAGRVALVTGASRGIGRATALALATAGARVALLARNADALASLVDSLAAHRADAVAVACDLTDGAAVSLACARVADSFGTPDVIVNAAGVFSLAPLHETTDRDLAAALEANVFAPFRVVRAFLTAMRARGSGHVVTVGSIADHTAFPENGAYAVSKFGVRGLHEVLREELRGSGVRATLVSPGPVDTSLWDPIGPDERPGFTPRARMLHADDVAAAILYAVTAPSRVNVDVIRLTPQ